MKNKDDPYLNYNWGFYHLSLTPMGLRAGPIRFAAPGTLT